MFRGSVSLEEVQESLVGHLAGEGVSGGLVGALEEHEGRERGDGVLLAGRLGSNPAKWFKHISEGLVVESVSACCAQPLFANQHLAYAVGVAVYTSIFLYTTLDRALKSGVVLVASVNKTTKGLA